MKQIIAACAIIFAATAALSASTAGNVRAGAKQYRRGNYEKSLDRFRQAQVSAPDNAVVNYDIGNALYKTGNFDEAALSYQKSLTAKDKKTRSLAYYNLGNTAYRKGDTAGALDHYKKALMMNPGDRDAKYNIEYILQQQKQQKQNQQNKQGNRQKKDGKGAQGAGQQQQKDASGKAGADKRDGMSKEDAERILQVFNEHDRESAKRRKTAAPKMPKTDEDW